MHRLLRKAGETADASFRHFLWAHSAFWSRAQSLAQLDSGQTDSSRSNSGGAVVEAIVPGMDFCNHSSRPNCRWELQDDQVGGGSRGQNDLLYTKGTESNGKCWCSRCWQVLSSCLSGA